MTRYVLASYLSNRDTRAATAVMRRAAAASAEPPKTIKTDKWRAYNRAIASVFPDAKHIKSEGLTAEINNNQSGGYRGHSDSADPTGLGHEGKRSTIPRRLDIGLQPVP